MAGAFSRLFNDEDHLTGSPPGFVEITDPITGEKIFIHRSFVAKTQGIGVSKSSLNFNAGTDAGGSMFVGLFGFSVSSGASIDTNLTSCAVTTGCFQFGLGFFGGAGISGSVGGNSLSTGASDGFGLFINGGTGAAAGTSANFGNGSAAGGKGFFGAGVGAAAGVQFCRTGAVCDK